MRNSMNQLEKLFFVLRYFTDTSMTLFEGLEDQKICAGKYLSASRENLHLGEELQRDVSTAATQAMQVCEVFSKNGKRDGKASGWAVGRAYSDTPFKPTVKKCVECNGLKENKQIKRRPYE